MLYSISLLFILFLNLFIYLWLCWVFVSVRGLSLVAASRGLSLSRPLLLRSIGSRRAGSVIVAHGPSCSAACGIFPDQGSNPCPLHWQADSRPLRHQGSPIYFIHSSLCLLIPIPLSCPSPLPSPHREPLDCFLYLWVCFYFAVYIHLYYFLDSTYKWYHTVFVFLCLTHFTKHNIL